MTNIYLLIYPNLKAFKIGKADNIFDRVNSMKKWWGEPDYVNSFSLAISSGLVFKLERGLHLLLEQFSMGFNCGDGKTEFFSLDAFNYAIEHLNTFIKSNQLDSFLVKGIKKPDIAMPRDTSKNRDYIFSRHNLGKKRLIGSLNDTFKRMETVLRVNNLLIKYRTSIRFSLSFNNGLYSLTLYDRKFLADILFENLRVNYNGFSSASAGRNFSQSLDQSESCYKLRFRFDHTSDDKLICFVTEELESSFKLLKKASINQNQQ